MLVMSKLVFPAWAGMNRPGTGKSHLAIGVPRVGGDEPVMDKAREAAVGCSPRGRG